MNLQDQSDACEKRFLEKVEEKIEDSSKLPTHAISRYCRMLVVYCDAKGKVTESFQKSMDKCRKEIIDVEGMEEILQECNECPENIL